MTVASPCRNICVMDAARGWCQGCFRTLEEIARWSGAADPEKESILAAVARRRGGGPGVNPASAESSPAIASPDPAAASPRRPAADAP